MDEDEDEGCSLKRRRSLEAKRPVESREASCRRLCLMEFILCERDSCSSLRDDVSSWRSLIRYFWPTDLMLRSRIPVMKKSWMKLSFLFIAFASSPS